jgi:hypothetical protein
LISILHLGSQYLTGVFPKTKEHHITSGPIELVKCQEDWAGNCCGLLQLKQSYDLDEMYGFNYGYRSSLNQSMVKHLHQKVGNILKKIEVVPGDIIVDIGSNDSTLLQAYPVHNSVLIGINDGTALRAYPKNGAVLVGIDPTGKKFKDYYPDYVQLVPEFFSASSFKEKFGGQKAKIITSIAMFYDMEEPLDFMRQVHEILADNGVWVFEQSYMPTMLEKRAYDTVCHEHLEYYRLKQIKWMTDRVGLKIIDVEFNDVNGGSFSVIAAKTGSPYKADTALVEKILRDEESAGLNTLEPYLEFRNHIYKHRDELRRFIEKVKSENKLIIGYGASTKGNVLLQFCEFNDKDIPFIAEVNEDKFGCYTPGTYIPIIPEAEARAMRPDYFLVFPWHFKESFLRKEKEYFQSGGKLIMPLPEVEVIDGTDVDYDKSSQEIATTSRAKAVIVK